MRGGPRLRRLAKQEATPTRVASHNCLWAAFSVLLLAIATPPPVVQAFLRQQHSTSSHHTWRRPDLSSIRPSTLSYPPFSANNPRSTTSTSPPTQSCLCGHSHNKASSEEESSPTPPNRRRHYNPQENNKRNQQYHPRSRRPRYQRQQNHRNNNASRRAWLQESTQRLLHSPAGSLADGKWHEVKSLFLGWAARAKFDSEAPLQMESLLQRLVKEEDAQQRHDIVDRKLYHGLLDAWACAALFKTHGIAGSQRALEILLTLQQTYEQQQQLDENYSSSVLQPDQKSFDVVMHAVTRTEGPLVARRLLAWKEYLYKTGRNVHARPTRADYVMVLDGYANSRAANAGTLAEGLLSHMKATTTNTTQGLLAPDTHCWNICIKAWTRSKRGREVAEHADRILEEMEAEPDIISYSTVVTAWAHSGMKQHAVSRAEEILQTVESHPTLEPNTVILNAVMSAWVKAKNPASVDRTYEILQQMTQSGKADLISYNTHLHALAMHGDVPGSARRADDILQGLETQQDSDLQPNCFSYNCALAACSKSADSDSAVRAVGVFQRLLRRRDIKPESFAFNNLLLAFSRSSLPNAAKMAHKWLGYMEYCSEKNIFPKARPETISYLAVISAYARSGTQGSAWEAEKVFHDLQEKYKSGRKELKPNKFIYNGMIDCWAKSKNGTFGARKAESLLKEMQRQYEAGDAAMQPDLVSYNGVLNAWAHSRTRCCARQAETYLERMWDLHENGNEKVKPDDKSYNTVINAISKSKHKRKAQRALRVLRMMDVLYRRGEIEARPSEITYTAVLNSCAFPVAKDSRSRRKALDTALFTLAELQSSEYCRPNEATYGTFIRACANLLHDDDDLRREVIEKAFKQCCKDGTVGDNVLTFLRKAAPSDLYQELLADFVSSGTMITASDLPLEWRCNAGGTRQSTRRFAYSSDSLLVDRKGLGKKDLLP